MKDGLAVFVTSRNHNINQRLARYSQTLPQEAGLTGRAGRATAGCGDLGVGLPIGLPLARSGVLNEELNFRA
jgi:hypothetical protein